MNDSIPITPEGLIRLKEELKQLKTVERPKNIKDIEIARAHGDLSENAEYSAAKERQGHINGRVAELEDVISRAQVIDPAGVKSEKVVFGATVTMSDNDSGDEITYQIVGIHESDVKAGRISVESPLAKSMIGKAVSDLVVLRTAKGTKEYEILVIEYR